MFLVKQVSNKIISRFRVFAYWFKWVLIHIHCSHLAVVRLMTFHRFQQTSTDMVVCCTTGLNVDESCLSNWPCMYNHKSKYNFVHFIYRICMFLIVYNLYIYIYIICQIVIWYNMLFQFQIHGFSASKKARIAPQISALNRARQVLNGNLCSDSCKYTVVKLDGSTPKRWISKGPW